MKKIILLTLLICTTACVTNDKQQELGEADAMMAQKDYKAAVPIYKTLAKGGNAEAAYHLAHIYMGGLGVEVRNVSAGYWMQKSAALDYLPAIIELGSMKYYGNMVSISKFEALKLFERAAKKGNNDGLFFAGNMHLNGDATQKDVNKAVKYFSQAAVNKDERAIKSLRELLNLKILTKNDTSSIIKIIRTRAESGLAGAQYSLGSLYHQGYYLPKDYDLALMWYYKAAQQANRDAQFQLGLHFISNNLDNKDPKEAEKWFVLAAAGDNISYQKELGTMLLLGEKLIQNSKGAFKWLLKSADGGDANSMFLVGSMYQNGKGTTKNIRKARIYLLKSAQLSYTPAFFSLAEIYEKEQDVRNFKKAFDFYTRSAYKGDVRAQQKLVYFYRSGLGTKKNSKLSYIWSLVAREYDSSFNLLSTEKALSVLEKNQAREAATGILKIIKSNE